MFLIFIVLIAILLELYRYYIFYMKTNLYTKYLLHCILQPQKTDKLQADINKCNMVEEALKEIMRHTVEGSYIVANNRVCCCSYDSLQSLRRYKIVDIEQLQKFDPPGKSKLLDNLGKYFSQNMFAYIFLCYLKIALA